MNQTSDVLSRLQEQVAALTTAVKNLSSQHHRHHRRHSQIRGRSSERYRSSSTGTPKSAGENTATEATAHCFYHNPIWQGGTEVRTTMQFPLGKRIGRTEVAPVSGLSSSHRLFIKDKITGLKYLVDTDSEVSVLPSSRVSARCPSAIQLHAANGTTIRTYGQRLLNVKIGLRRQFPWVFLVGDVQQPILGADFLTNFSLQVDLSSNIRGY